jgi:hypothetical protein
VLVLIVALPVASAAGCGGDEETSQTEAPAPTEQEFIAQADAICRSAGQDLTAQSKGLGFYTPDGLDEEEAEFIEQEIIPFYQRQVDEIRELTPPPGEEEEIEAALSAAEQALDDLREDPSSYAPPVGPDGERITTVPKGWLELTRQLKRYGSKACAN